MENLNRKEIVEIGEYTIEHILPQNENLSLEWRTALGPDWKAIQEKYLHTVGNLTLTGYNSEYSDRSFKQKRDMQGGFADSPIRLNRRLSRLDEWNAHAIEARAEALGEEACEVWAVPIVPESMLQKKSPDESRGKSVYSIVDHQHLAPGAHMRPVFDVLRREILALDPSISEEYLKLYVAYKAETNVVDIVPQAGSLRLSLNMPYPEIRDPRQLTADVTNVGRWGNGDVELRVRSVGDIPYAVGLIRQSLERQLGTTDDTGQLVGITAD